MTQVVKHLVSRTRLDGSDEMSFFSRHTAVCMAVERGRWMSLCGGVGWGRIAADQHWLSDVGVGVLAGGTIQMTVTW